MRPRKATKTNRNRSETLDRALGAWHASEGSSEALSAEARDAIFNEFRRLHASGGRPAAHQSLFLPATRWAWGAAVPILALSLLVGSVLLTQGPYDRGVLVSPHPRVEVSKAGENVVFVIQNGHRSHTVSKSTDPASVGSAETFTTTTGRFDDRLDSGTDIVYYRID